MNLQGWFKSYYLLKLEPPFYLFIFKFDKGKKTLELASELFSLCDSATFKLYAIGEIVCFLWVPIHLAVKRINTVLWQIGWSRY
jgi:hypothetical protein